ncbi:hypothetical protein V5799_012707 [Amblyomma americanum]|uniref:Uncharacterized protein n=1 Tax=Amblyomma americanum TaxID=6943 RepID=A0AAQ4E843_AMBAM
MPEALWLSCKNFGWSPVWYKHICVRALATARWGRTSWKSETTKSPPSKTLPLSTSSLRYLFLDISPQQRITHATCSGLSTRVLVIQLTVVARIWEIKRFYIAQPALRKSTNASRSVPTVANTTTKLSVLLKTKRGCLTGGLPLEHGRFITLW